MGYFELAVNLTRAEAAPTLAKVASKAIALKTIKNRAQETCCCSSYSFPHRAGSGWCPGVNRNDERSAEAERTREEINAEELALFDRAEARAVNSGAR
jgi:hypothetical protein